MVAEPRTADRRQSGRTRRNLVRNKIGGAREGSRGARVVVRGGRSQDSMRPAGCEHGAPLGGTPGASPFPGTADARQGQFDRGVRPRPRAGCGHAEPKGLRARGSRDPRPVRGWRLAPSRPGQLSENPACDVFADRQAGGRGGGGRVEHIHDARCFPNHEVVDEGAVGVYRLRADYRSAISRGPPHPVRAAWRGPSARRLAGRTSATVPPGRSASAPAPGAESLGSSALPARPVPARRTGRRPLDPRPTPRSGRVRRVRPRLA